VSKEEITMDERWKYLRKMRERYRGASRQERTRLLDEIEQVTGMHRKSLIWLDRIVDLTLSNSHFGSVNLVHQLVDLWRAVVSSTSRS